MPSADATEGDTSQESTPKIRRGQVNPWLTFKTSGFELPTLLFQQVNIQLFLLVKIPFVMANIGGRCSHIETETMVNREDPCKTMRLTRHIFLQVHLIAH